jgi:NAD(P)-dependent dehydrogenase (short-subunit alcohol dehydrogenase family)
MSTIVMTGGTSGLGKTAVRRIAAARGARLLLGARGPGPADVQTLPLDLASLSSVRDFASAVGDRIGDTGINALVLNAGMSPPDGDGRTADGYETTFAVNHLAHYLLIRLLLPRLADKATVVLTTSGTHDPAQGTIVPPPRHADAHLLAHPDADPDRDERPRTAAGRAYSSSKLCNVLTARALAAHPDARSRRLIVLAYNPGATPGTGLIRDAPVPVRLGWSLLGSPLRVLVPRFNSRAAAGGALADIALGVVDPPPGRVYAALRRGTLTWPDPSELARRDDARDALWRDSAALAGLPA